MKVIIIVFFLVIQSMADRDDGKIKNTIDDSCGKLAHEYNEVAKNLYGYKRDFYIMICLIIGFPPIVAIIVYIVKKRQRNEALFRQF